MIKSLRKIVEEKKGSNEFRFTDAILADWYKIQVCVRLISDWGFQDKTGMLDRLYLAISVILSLCSGISDHLFTVLFSHIILYSHVLAHLCPRLRVIILKNNAKKKRENIKS